MVYILAFPLDLHMQRDFKTRKFRILGGESVAKARMGHVTPDREKLGADAV